MRDPTSAIEVPAPARKFAGNAPRDPTSATFAAAVLADPPT
jgi:hypothetical protein